MTATADESGRPTVPGPAVPYETDDLGELAVPAGPGAPVPVPGPAMREAIGGFVTGVSVVTTAVDDEASGMTINSLTSVSLKPAILLVSLTRDARTTEAVLSVRRFAVSILSARQEHIARRFARAGEDHFAGLPLAYGEHAVPVVPAALAHLECQVLGAQGVGDHRVIFGLVTGVCQRSGDPLTFLRGRFGDFTGRDEDVPLWFF